MDTTSAPRRTVIRNVRVFDGNGLTQPQDIVIDGGLIGDNATEADEVYEGNNGVLLPGLIDAHVHLHHTGHLQQLADFGVTTALDMATWPAEKMNGLRNQRGLTNIRSAGLPATVSGSVHSCLLPLPNEAMVSGPAEAEDFVRKRIAEGSDYIKLISDVPGPSQEILSALSTSAHSYGRKVVAHASSYRPFQMALDADVDIVTHAPLDKALDDDLVNRMVASKVFSVPTLTMMQEVSKPPPSSALWTLLSRPSLILAIFRSRRNSMGQQNYENARQSVKAMYEAGVPILAGTDCHEEPTSFCDVKHGESLHRELELLLEAGMSNIDVLRAATNAAAECFGLNDRGVIAKGKRADLVLLREDPTVDIRASRSIEQVWCGGIAVRR